MSWEAIGVLAAIATLSWQQHRDYSVRKEAEDRDAIKLAIFKLCSVPKTEESLLESVSVDPVVLQKTLYEMLRDETLVHNAKTSEYEVRSHQLVRTS